METTELAIDTAGRHVLDLTDRAAGFAAQAGGDGLLSVFVPHATAGLAVMETGSGSEEDLEEVLGRLLPRAHRPGAGRPPPARHMATHLPRGPERRQPPAPGPTDLPPRLSTASVSI